MSTVLRPPRPVDSLPQTLPALATAISFGGDRYKTWSFPESAFKFRPSPISDSAPFQPDATGNDALRLPALATLASIASQHQPMTEKGAAFRSRLSSDLENCTKDAKPEHSRKVDKPNSVSNKRPADMSYATVAPGQSIGFANGFPPVCGNCQTSTTPLWRRDEDGNVLCNACGLFLKLHGRARPISLKTNIIKSRNRVKPSGPSNQQRQQDQGLQPKKRKSLPATAAAPAPGQSSANASVIPQQGLPEQLEGSSNIAPQHMFDSMTMDAAHQHTFVNLCNAGYLPQRNGSPSASSLLNGLGDAQNGHADLSQTPNDLVASNNHLKTRVSELEVINNLFRERVAELEGGEGETKRALEDALAKVKNLEARVAELEGTAPNGETEAGSPEPKRRRLSRSTEDREEGAAGSSSNSGTAQNSAEAL